MREEDTDKLRKKRIDRNRTHRGTIVLRNNRILKKNHALTIVNKIKIQCKGEG